MQLVLTMNKKVIALILIFLVGGIGVGYGLGYVTYQPQVLTMTDRYNNVNAEYGELLDSYDRLYNKRIYCTVVYQVDMIVPNVTQLEDGAFFMFPLNMNYNITDVLVTYNVTETWIVHFWLGSLDAWIRYLEGKGLAGVGGVLESASDTISLGTQLSAIGAFERSDILNYVIIFKTNWEEEVRLDFKIDIVLAHYKTH